MTFSFGILATVIYNDSVTREALSREDELKFIKFVHDDPYYKRYYVGVYILFNTGLRISEFVGLIKSDIDFENMKINVENQLQRYAGVGYSVMEPKTQCGIIQVPMTEEVAECFKRILAK